MLSRFGAPQGSTAEVSTSMAKLMMERERQKLEDGVNNLLTNKGRICFSCEQIFANQKFLEEHVCPSASHICSCGTEFAVYEVMLHHSTTHEPGHQVLDHETIKKRRIEKCKEEEEKLKRLQLGEVVWEAPKLDTAPSISLPVNPMLQVPIASSCMPQTSIQRAQISQVPTTYPSMPAPLLPTPIQSETEMQNIFAGVGAPTVDLWTLYQPVVVLQMERKFNKKQPYTCGKCGECFAMKNCLISHNSAHVTDKISGCIGCGLLLSSKKLVPRFHICNSPNTATKLRLITARPLNHKKQIEAIERSQNSNAQSLNVTTSLQLRGSYPIAANKGSQMLHVNSALQLKSHNYSAPKPVSASILSKSQSPNPVTSNKSRWRLPDTPPAQLKMPTNAASGAMNRPMQTSSAANSFPCRVCHIPFETAQLLQRHKCIKAHEFMAKHARAGKRFCRQNRVTPVAGPSLTQMNGERKLGFPASVNMKNNQMVPVSLDKGKGAVPLSVKTGGDLDDDCYIVERGPDKPAEMIYQVTSSVPIKT